MPKPEQKSDSPIVKDCILTVSLYNQLLKQLSVMCITSLLHTLVVS